jgi:signal transduction histidine kinase/DNA-binding response OmpR family regulator/streptogramin lyase
MKVIPAILLILLVAAPLRADIPWKPEFSLKESWRWSELDSLKPYEIICGARGPGGEVWFAHSGGLIAYKGLEIEEFPIPEFNSLTVEDIFVASDGRVFVTTQINYMVWKDGTVHKIEVPGGSATLRNAIVESPDGQILIASRRGIYALDGLSLREIETGVSDVTAILLDKQEKLWVSERGGRPIQVYTLEKIADRNLAVQEHSFPSSGINSLGPWLFMDSAGRVWVIDPDADDQCYLYENYVRKPAFAGLRENSLLRDSFEVIEPAPGQLWFCVSRNLVRIKDGQLDVYDIDDYPIPPTYPYLIDLGEDRILIGGRKLIPQVLNLSMERWSTYKGLNFQCEDQGGGLWFISKDREVARLHGGQWEVFDSRDGVIDTPNRIIAGSDNSIWVSGSHQGEASVAVRMNGDWEAHHYPQIGKTFSHLAAIETADGDFIFGGGTPVSVLGDALGGAVIFKKDGSQFTGKHYPPPSFTGRTANLVERAGDGLLFSVSSVFKMRSNKEYINQTQHLFKNRFIDHMIVDQDNQLWVASVGEGVYKHDGKDWEYHGPEKGLDTKNVIYLLEDRAHDQILALTGKGIYSFDGRSWGRWGAQFNMRFIRENHTLFQSSDGAIWLNFTNRRWLLEQKDFGQHNYDFQTIRYIPERQSPQTYASISSEAFPEGSQTQVLFRASDYWNDTPSEDLVFSWKLNGDDWTAFHKQQSVTFDNLTAGGYDLQVRARDLDGNIDTTPAGLRFAVIAPLWKQPWFILLILAAGLLIVFLLYTLYRIRIKAALALDEFKLDFFTNISHELRNPLAVIISPIEGLLESSPEDGARKKLQMVLRNARKMQGMVDQLLEFRKLEKKRWSILPEGGEIVGFTREAVQEHEPRWLAKGQRLEMTLSRESHLCAFDSGILQKVVDNLLSNAIKYSDENTAIQVAVNIADADDGSLYRLTVEDEGPGIPLHEQRNVLQPFYRVKRDTKVEGSGVGLAMVNQLVSLWGGSLKIESPVTPDGRGTRFTVQLPLEPYKEHEPSAQPAGKAARRGQDTLLIIDDNEDLRHILVDAFQDSYQILESGDGLDGFELARKKDPDLVISDVMMPGMDGFALCEKLKTDPETSHIPVILLTARSSVEHRIEGIKAGADAYIAKPLDVHHLNARVENLLESRRELKAKFARQLVIEATEITVTPTDELILKKAIKIVEDHMQDEDFDVNKFGELMGMSRSTMKRKIKAVTGLSSLAFIQKLRLKRAAHLLTTSDRSVSEIAAMVGFYDLSYFGKLFKREFGEAPSTYAGR